jgi:hypothetical protein
MLPQNREQAGADGLLPGTVTVDFFDPLHGWSIVQRGQCQGEKRPTSSAADPLECTQEWLLLATADGGLTWSEISPPAPESP